MADLVIPLDYPAARLSATAGGKGASLARMTASGLPVPMGFIATTEAFQRIGPIISEDLERQLTATDPTDTKALDPLCQTVRQDIVNQGVPKDVASAVAAAYWELADGTAVAVRSSATAEDLPWASFAGQYDSFLNVVGQDQLLERLSQVWASLYSTRAVSYRLQLGMSLGSVRMAVVVQRQLQPRAAGVLFTRDPVTGREGHYQVTAAFGLGEGVVTGRAPADNFTLDGATGEVFSQTLTRKVVMMTLAQGGGIEPSPVPADWQETAAMTQPQLERLGGLARHVTQLFHDHQDIEFAVEGNKVWLLQARPITAMGDIPPFQIVWEDPADAEFTWARDQYAGQRPTFKLQEDANRLYAEGRRVCFQETGAPMARSHILRFFNGFAYSRSPIVADAEVSERQYRHAARDRDYREHGTTSYDAEIRPQVEQTLAKLGEFRPKKATLSALVAHLDEALLAYGHVMGDLHWRMAPSASLDWPSTYHEVTGEPEVASGTLLQAISNKTTLLVRRLRNLARLVQQDPDLTIVFQKRTYNGLREEPLRGRSAVRRFHTGFRSLLRAYGLRTGRGFGSGTDFTSPTWNMDPHQPLDIIASYAKQDLSELERREKNAKQERRRAVLRVRRMLTNDPDRLLKFERALALAVEGVKRTENHNHIMEQGVTGSLRQAIFWTGQGLVREGALDNPDDVLHLSLPELDGLAKQRGPDELKNLIKERAEEFQAHARLQPPETLGKVGQMGGPPPPNPRAIFDIPPDAGVDGLLLRGTGASPGRATGRARVVAMTQAPPSVERGDILVARNVGPAWTPILPLLAGLVLDGGAVFQHAALVAREYGIPAVIMTRDATSVILDGQAITVDADQSFVDLMPSP